MGVAHGRGLGFDCLTSTRTKPMIALRTEGGRRGHASTRAASSEQPSTMCTGPHTTAPLCAVRCDKFADTSGGAAVSCCCSAGPDVGSRFPNQPLPVRRLRRHAACELAHAFACPASNAPLWPIGRASRDSTCPSPLASACARASWLMAAGCSPELLLAPEPALGGGAEGGIRTRTGCPTGS